MIKLFDERIITAIKRIVVQKEFEQNPTFYLYDLHDVDEKLQLLIKKPNNVSLYYAIKANSNLDLMHHIIQNETVQGFEIASTGELQRSLAFCDPDRIIFTGPGKTPFELEESVMRDIRLINIESVVEAVRLNKIGEKYGKKIDVLVRINTKYSIDGVLANMTGESTKLGIVEEHLEESLNRISQMTNINMCGFHVFTASGVLDHNNLLSYVNYVFSLMSTLRQKGWNMDIIDFGGGFGIDYSGNKKKFDTHRFFDGLTHLNNKYGFNSIEQILELGRYIVGESGYYVAEIIDIKDSRGKKHIVAAGGVNHLRLPSASGVNQPVYIIPMNKPKIISSQPYIEEEIVDVNGPLCFSEDKIAHDVHIESAKIGDLVVVAKTGAYGYSVSSLEFLMHPKPPEYILNGSEII